MVLSWFWNKIYDGIKVNHIEGVQNVVTPTAFVQIQQGRIKLVWPKSIANGEFTPKKGW